MKSVGFNPIARPDAHLLILGSLPGTMSLEKHQYYAQPRNAFWPIMEKLVGASPQLPYARRTAQLTKHKIALWDMCAAGIRPGSLDSDIERDSIEPNDFAGFFLTHPHIQCICFNGAKAAEIYRRLVLPHLLPAYQTIPSQLLPSTSPANAGMSFAQKLALWQAAITPHIAA